MDKRILLKLFEELADRMFKKPESGLLEKNEAKIRYFGNESTQAEQSLFLKFKTGGMRAVMGNGFDRINLVTCNMIASTIATKFKSVVIGFDHRINSDLYAYTIFKVLKANKINPKIYRCCATPYLAWKSLDYDVGIMITASHNSREYNGFKVYVKGSQVVTPLDQELESIFYRIPFTDIELGKEVKNYNDNGERDSEYRANFAWQKELKKNLSEIDYESFFESYRFSNLNNKISEYKKSRGLSLNEDSKQAKTKVVFSALNGVSFPFIKKVEDIFDIEFMTDNTQNKVNGSFPGIDFPNPEIKENWLALLEEYQRTQSEDFNNLNEKYYLFMCDPDGDRFGLAELQHGNLVIYNGNEIAKIFLWFYLNVFKDNLGLVNTFLCDDMFSKVSQARNIPYLNTKTGFKNVSKAVKELKEKISAQNTNSESHVLAFEDTLGYLFDHSTERDGIKAAILMYHILRLKDVSEILKDLENFGKIESYTKFVRVNDPTKTLETILNKLLPVSYNVNKKKMDQTLEKKFRLIEYKTIHDGHILLFDKFKVILRISGTESVLKVYSFSEVISKELLQMTVEEFISELAN